MTHSVEFRRRVLRVRGRDGLSFAQVSDRFSVGIASVKRWSKRLEPKPYERRKIRKIDPEHLTQDVRDYPDAYQYERAARFGVTAKAIWQALKKLNITYKKSTATSEGRRKRQAILPGEDRRT
jgi:transposase